MNSSATHWTCRAVILAAFLNGLSLLAGVAAGADESISGDATISAPAGPSRIVITTTQRLAGAVHSLTWNGREFIDSTDHGRQLQSASNLDAGSLITAETFNPTEAGSRFDGAGRQSSSRLLHRLARGHQLQTTTQMAFWLRPGETSGPHPAKNTSILSDHLLTKRITIGWNDLPHVIQYDVTFGVPVGERHSQAVFETVTGYMPPDFSRFWKLNLSSGELEPLTDGPGEQPQPVVLATEDARHAMGIITFHHRRPHETGPGYGRWRFGPEKVVKWNCVFRVRPTAGLLEPGDYSYRCFVVVGDLETVRHNLLALQTRIATRP